MTQQAALTAGTDILEQESPIVSDTEPESPLLPDIIPHGLMGSDQASGPPWGSPISLWESHVRAIRDLLYLEIVQPFVLPMMIPDVWVDTSSSQTVVSSVVDPLLPRPSAQETIKRFLHSIRSVSAALAAWVPAEAATDLDTGAQRRRADLVSHLESAFSDAAEEVFEAGFESDFSRKLRAVVMACGDQAIDALAEVMQSDGSDINTKAEALNQLGLIPDPYSHRTRLEMLIRYLASPDAALRDSASVALAAIDDPVAIQAVRRAVAHEPSPTLRRDLNLVLGQLEETQRCSSSG